MKNTIYLFLKRITSRIIDILIPSITSTLGYILYLNSINKSVNNIDNNILLLIIWFFYTLFVFLSVLHFKNKTFGDFLLKIRLKSLSNGDIKISKLLAKEFYISIILLGLFIFNYGWLIFIISFFPMGKSSDNKIPLITTDAIFKLAYEPDKQF